MKHINISFVKDIFKKNEFKIECFSTDEMVVDIYVKRL